MPAQGLPWLPPAKLLRVAEISRLARIAHAGGVRDFRITGGEPLIRRDVCEIVREIATLGTAEDPIDLALTTNAVLLDKFAKDLKDAGLSRINVSLDTLRPERFKKLTLRDQLGRVFAGLASAKEVGLFPIKLNTLLMPGVNEDEILDLVDYARREGFELRFIEQMPLGNNPWNGSTIITQVEILEKIAEKHVLTEVPGRGSAPAATWYVDGGPQKIGVIASVTRPFCGGCDRLRLTADGMLRTCLFSDRETDLVTPLRSGASDLEIAQLMGLAVHEKEPGHLIGKAGFKLPKRGMSAIGG